MSYFKGFLTITWQKARRQAPPLPHASYATGLRRVVWTLTKGSGGSTGGPGPPKFLKIINHTMECKQEPIESNDKGACNCVLRNVDGEIQTWRPILFLVSLHIAMYG